MFLLLLPVADDKTKMMCNSNTMNERLIAGDNRSRQNLNNQQEISSNNNDVILEDLIDMKKTNKVPMSYYRKVFILLGTGILFAAAIYSTTSFFSYATRPVGFRKNASVHGKDTYTWSKSFSQEEEEEEEEGIAFVFNQSPESSSKDVTFHEVGPKTGFCCCFADPHVEGAKKGNPTCHASDEQHCLCDSPEWREEKFFPLPETPSIEENNYTYGGACQAGDTFWWSSKTDCVNRVKPTYGGHSLNMRKVIKDMYTVAATTTVVQEEVGLQRGVCKKEGEQCATFNQCCEGFKCDSSFDSWNSAKCKKGSCFSSQSMVDVMGGGTIPIHKVKVGPSLALEENVFILVLRSYINYHNIIHTF